ncbi:MAG: B12-binding domain-containing radical SAM protein [Promethearchaeota archaeon]
MRIALVFPNILKNYFIKMFSFHQSLGLAMIAAVLLKAGHEVKVFDATAEKLNIHELTKKIKEFNPDVIGITANVAIAYKSVLTAKWLKRKFPLARMILGGPWASIEYEKLLNERAADFVVIGEGEKTIVELIDAIENEKGFTDIPGIAFNEEGSIQLTNTRDFINDLDSLPFPAWELFPPPKKYFFNTKGKNFYPIMTSRGCPYGCINCTKVIHGYKIRKRSIDSVVEEIIYLHERFKASTFLIIDDNFNHDVKRAEEICEKIAKLPFKTRFHFSNGIRADKISPKLAWLFKEIGVYDVCLGIESGNQDIVYKIGKNLKLENVIRAVKLLKKVNIFTTGFIMIGLPFETLSTVMDTKRFILTSGLDDAHIFKVIPFPGTKMFEIFKEKGYLKSTNSNSLESYINAKPAYYIPSLPPEVIHQVYQDLYKSFYLRTPIIKKVLQNILFRSPRWYLNFTFIILLKALLKIDLS